MTQTRVVATLIVVGLLCAMPATSRAIDEDGVVYLSANATYASFGWKFTVDPWAVQGFSLTVEADDPRAEFVGVNFINGFVQADEWVIVGNEVQHIEGIWPSASPGPTVDVDVFEVLYNDTLMDPSTQHQVSFTAKALETMYVPGQEPPGVEVDYVSMLDKDLNPVIYYNLVGQDPQIISATANAPIPEPTSLAVWGTGLLVLMGYSCYRRRRLR